MIFQMSKSETALNKMIRLFPSELTVTPDSGKEQKRKDQSQIMVSNCTHVHIFVTLRCFYEAIIHISFFIYTVVNINLK